MPQALSGLYLTISVGGRSHTTTLAGHRLPHAVPGGPGITQAELDDVRGALFGRALIAVEGAAPGPSQVLDAWYADKLSLRRLFDAVQARDDDGVIAAWEQGLSRTPSALALRAGLELLGAACAPEEGDQPADQVADSQTGQEPGRELNQRTQSLAKERDHGRP